MALAPEVGIRYSSVSSGVPIRAPYSVVLGSSGPGSVVPGSPTSCSNKCIHCVQRAPVRGPVSGSQVPAGSGPAGGVGVTPRLGQAGQVVRPADPAVLPGGQRGGLGFAGGDGGHQRAV